MSRQPVTLETLALATSLLRQKGPHPIFANDIAIDVLPIVRAMGEAMAGIGEHARPDNWDDQDDAEQYAAWLAFDAALAAFHAGRVPAPVTEQSGETA